MKIIYLASPYSHPEKDIIDQRFHRISHIASVLNSKGIVALSPITYGHTLLTYTPMPTDWEFWRNFCLSFLQHSSELWIVKMEGWNKSSGVAEEIEFAIKNSIPIKYVEDDDQIISLIASI